VEVLSLSPYRADIQDLADLEHLENLTEVRFSCSEGPSVEETLPIFKRCRHLRRLQISTFGNNSVPPIQLLCNFIMGMKYLTYLRLYIYELQSEILRDQVNEIILPHRPNFEFVLS